MFLQVLSGWPPLALIGGSNFDLNLGKSLACRQDPACVELVRHRQPWYANVVRLTE